MKICYPYPYLDVVYGDEILLAYSVKCLMLIWSSVVDVYRKKAVEISNRYRVDYHVDPRNMLIQGFSGFGIRFHYKHWRLGFTGLGGTLVSQGSIYLVEG